MCFQYAVKGLQILYNLRKSQAMIHIQLSRCDTIHNDNECFEVYEGIM